MGITLYGYVYCTTNTVNGRKYIGKRRSSNIEDGYFGSGTLLRRAIQKYGADCFKKEVLALAYSEEELCDLEIFHIEHAGAASRADYYNIAAGGNGGNTLLGLSAAKRQMRARSISLGLTGKPKSETTRLRLRWAKIGRPKNWSKVTREQYAARRKQEVALGIHPPPPCVARGFQHSAASKRLQAERKRADHARAKAERGSYRSEAGVEQWRQGVEASWTDEKREAHRTLTRARISRHGHNNAGAKWYHDPNFPSNRALLKTEPPLGWIRGKGPTGPRIRE